MAEVDGEKMEGGFVGNYFFCVPTIAAATAEAPKGLSGEVKDGRSVFSSVSGGFDQLGCPIPQPHPPQQERPAAHCARRKIDNWPDSD